jgi:hypothetical protein
VSLLAVRGPDRGLVLRGPGRGLMLIAFIITTPPVAD